jgi:hypothetical protein
MMGVLSLGVRLGLLNKCQEDESFSVILIHLASHRRTDGNLLPVTLLLDNDHQSRVACFFRCRERPNKSMELGRNSGEIAVIRYPYLYFRYCYGIDESLALSLVIAALHPRIPRSFESKGLDWKALLQCLDLLGSTVKVP